MPANPYPTENEVRKTLFKWISCIPKLHAHTFGVFNEAKRTYAGSMNALKTGLKKGVSDIIVTLPSEYHVGLMLELKRHAKSPVAKEQKDWLDLHVSLGWGTAIAYGLDEAIEVLTDYMNNIYINKR